MGGLKVIAKATFFDSDSGVGAELATFESIVRKQRAVVDPLTLESVLKSENRLAELQKALKISDGKLDELRSMLEGTKNVCDEIKKDADEGLEDNKLFTTTTSRQVHMSANIADSTLRLRKAHRCHRSGTSFMLLTWP